MPDQAYKVIEIIGVSEKSWEDATQNAVRVASESIRHPRVAEITEMDVTVDEQGHINAYRVKVHLSFKYEHH